MDDVLLNKAAIIERCLKRVNSLYLGYESMLEQDIDRQDAIILNLQRACEAAIDAAMYLVKIYKLGLPQSSADAFLLIDKQQLIVEPLTTRLRKMVGFRNIAIHEYQELNIDIVRNVIEKGSLDLAAFAACLVKLGSL